MRTMKRKKEDVKSTTKEKFPLGTFYPSNQTNPDSITYKSSPRSIAYHDSLLGQREKKVQVYHFKSNPGQSIASTNKIPAFSYRSGPDNGQIIGNKVAVKEITLKFRITMDIPAPDAEGLPQRIPQFTIKYALVYSKQAYNGTGDGGESNTVYFDDVFGGTDPMTGTAYPSVLAPQRMGTNNFVVMLQRLCTLGGFTPILDTGLYDGYSVTVPHQNSQPFFHFTVDHLNLWDETNIHLPSANLRPGSRTPLFSNGLYTTFLIDKSLETGELYNKIETGSFWVVAAIEPRPDAMAFQPTIEYFVSTVYVDRE